MSEAAKALPLPAAPRVDLPALIALLIGTAIISWTGILVRFLDVGPLAGAAWRMTLALRRWRYGRGSPPKGARGRSAWPPTRLR